MTGAGQMRLCQVVEVVTHSPGLKSFSLPLDLRAQPGQFVMLWLPGVDEKPLSISWAGNGLVELTVKAVGPFTHRIMRLAPGDWVGIRGPFGRPFTVQAHSLLVGGGVGAAPLRFLAHVLREHAAPFTFLCGVRTRGELIFERQLQEWGCLFTSDDGSCGTCGMVTDLLDEVASERPVSMVCASGPEAMLVKVIRWAHDRGIPYEVSLERYMKCGIGLCGSCCLDGSGIRVCTEGPVLTAAEIAHVRELGLPRRDASGQRPA